MNTEHLQAGKLVDTGWLITNCTLLSAVNSSSTLIGPDDAWEWAVGGATLGRNEVCLLVEVGESHDHVGTKRLCMLLLVGERLLYAYKTLPSNNPPQAHT